MRKYISIWVIIAIVVNVTVFSYLSVDGGSNIRCNRLYRKVYPCDHREYEAVNEIWYDSDGNPFEVQVLAPKDDEPFNNDPWLDVDHAERKGSDMAVLLEVHVGINIVLAGAAILLYFVLLNLEERKYQLSSVFSVCLVAFIVGSGFACYYLYSYIRKPGGITEIHYNAPIIYLYDEQEREATVKLDLNGDLTCTYPKYNDETGWIVKTSLDGTLTDANGRQYEYLYWEADLDMVPDFSKGFCVRGEDSAEFLEKALADLGLSDTEANTFIMYWLPQLEENPYNVIAFQDETYEEAAKLDVDPVPDTVVRVNMVFYGSDEYVEVAPQDLTSMNPSVSEREGLTLVEWGGGRLD